MSGICGLSYLDILVIVGAILVAVRWTYRIVQDRKDRKQKAQHHLQ
jgi:hypothetical protein